MNEKIQKNCTNKLRQFEWKHLDLGIGMRDIVVVLALQGGKLKLAARIGRIGVLAAALLSPIIGGPLMAKAVGRLLAIAIMLAAATSLAR